MRCWMRSAGMFEASPSHESPGRSALRGGGGLFLHDAPAARKGGFSLYATGEPSGRFERASHSTKKTPIDLDGPEIMKALFSLAVDELQPQGR